MKIRDATVQDAQRLAEIGRVMHDESSFASLGYDVEQTASYLLGLLVNKSLTIFMRVVENDEGVIVGGMIGYCTKSWFGPDMIANDIALFMLPEARGGMAAVRLIKAYVEWAKQVGAKQIRPGVSTGAVGSSAGALYTRLGFAPVGSIYCLEV